jgi:hypothetical protein
MLISSIAKMEVFRRQILYFNTISDLLDGGVQCLFASIAKMEVFRRQILYFNTISDLTPGGRFDLS